MNAPIQFDRSFASHEKAKYWSEKNGKVKPKDVYKGSHKQYWFDCDKCPHSFNSVLKSVNAGQWCPYCSSSKLCDDSWCDSCFTRSFASHEKEKYWSEKNGDVKPKDVYKNSDKKCWFDCDKCNHCFNSVLKSVNAGKWCPYCSVPPKKLCDNAKCDDCFKKSFASHEKAKYWSDKNGDVKPRDAFKNSYTKYWFDCDKCPHSFDSSLSNVTCGKWCPYCANKKVCNEDCNHCFEKSFASHEKAKYWSDKNSDTNPRYVFKSSGNKYWFDCNNCNHCFDKALDAIISGGWCPYCRNQKRCNDECIKCFNNSFASHEKAKYWSEKNGDVNPRDVSKSSGTKYWFDCDKCNHCFNSTLSHVSSGGWCPYCANKKRCNYECIKCFNNSFASHEKSKYWSKKNGDVNPNDVSKSNGTKYWFDCDKCNHSFDIKLSQIVNGGWCPYCAVPSKKVCNDVCNHCFEKSFASHEKAKYWSDKNGVVKPRYVFKGTSTKYWFDCNKCNHSFDTGLSSITAGNWCPYCKNKTETKLFDALKPLYPTLITQFKQEWCKNKSCLPFDFCIPEHKIIIELDGRQHFKQVWNWTSPEKQFENDKYKEKCANENGYSVIRLLQEDVLNNKHDWFDRIQTEIENIIKDDTIIHNVYMAEDGEYDAYITE